MYCSPASAVPLRRGREERGNSRARPGTGSRSLAARTLPSPSHRRLIARTTRSDRQTRTSPADPSPSPLAPSRLRRLLLPLGLHLCCPSLATASLPSIRPRPPPPDPPALQI